MASHDSQQPPQQPPSQPDTVSQAARDTSHDERANRFERAISRRVALKRIGGAGLVAASTFGALEALTLTPKRAASAAPANLPAIQYNLAGYIAPAQSVDGVSMLMPPVYTLYLTAQLTRTPTKQDQKKLADALDAIESAYAFSPSGVFTCVSYGIPYFNRLPGGMTGAGVVTSNLPRLLADNTRFALEEAIPGPTDVSPQNAGIQKQTFNVPVAIEQNDILFTLRSDALDVVTNVAAWLQDNAKLNGQQAKSGLKDMFSFTSQRLSFIQAGLPRKMAEQYNLPYASRINPNSPMWMGFFSLQNSGFGPAEIATFQGNASAKFTTCASGDYFYDGGVQIFAHDILDLAQFYADGQTYSERAQQMFRSNPAPSDGNADQYTNGGGPTALENTFTPPNAQGQSDAEVDAMTNQRLGHLQTLQRVTRAPDGSIVPQRIDGPGFDAMDVPDGSNQPKLQFSAFLPSTNNFRKARINQASLDLAQKYNVPDSRNGIERFLTATRRQNFLAPPRAHRAFPLLELS